MMMNVKNKMGAFAAALLMVGFLIYAFASAPAQAADKVKVRMISDWAFQAQAAVFTNAIEKGYFRQAES